MNPGEDGADNSIRLSDSEAAAALETSSRWKRFPGLVPPRTVLGRYAFMLAAVFLATLGRFVIVAFFGPEVANPLYFVATIVTAYYAGVGPALVSVILGKSLGVLLTLRVQNINAIVLLTRLGVTVPVEMLVISFVEGAKRMRRRLRNEIDERIRLAEIEREQGERLRITLRSIADGVIVTDPEGRITSMNPVAESLTGWLENEGVGCPLATVFQLFRPDMEGTGEIPSIEEMLRSRAARTVEQAPLMSRDGKSRTVKFSTSPMKDARGHIFGIVLAFHDDTERFQTEQRLAKQTEIAETLHSIGQRIASELVPQRIRRLVIEESARLLGADLAAYFSKGQSAPDILIHREKSRIDPFLGSSPLLAEIFEEERVIRVQDFQREPQRLIAAPRGARSFLAVRVESRSGRTFGALVFAHGEPRKFGATAERLTVGIAAQTAVALDNARLYQDLRESELRFRQMAEHISDVFYMMHPEGGDFLYLSPAFEAIGGKPVEAVYRDSNAFLEPIHKDDLARLGDSLEGEVNGTPTADDEYRIVRPDGALRWIRDRAFPVVSDKGKLQMVVGIAEDVTARKTAEEALKESDRRKDEFLAMLAHELRNPLAPIRNAIHLVRQSERMRNDPSAAELEIVERQVTHMTRLIDDLLDVSRISRGKITLRREPISITDVVQRAVATNRALIEGSGHELRVVLPDDCPWILADSTRIEQVLGNLLNNASKYTDPGGTIELMVVRESDQVRLSVRDSGIGIDPSLLPKVFDLFMQAEQPIDRAKGGLGIGLSLVRNLVGLHGGAVEAKSDGLGYGSEFIVRLPMTQPPAELVKPKPGETGRVDPATRVDGRSHHARKVLVVDDNGDAATTLARILTKLWKQNVRVAGDGPSALQVAREFHPELIFLDIGLPGLNGYQVAQELRADPDFSATVLVAVTGWGQESDIKKSRESGFHRHLVKPVAIDSIAAIIEDFENIAAEKPPGVRA